MYNKLIFISTLALGICIATCTKVANDKVEKAFKANQIIPDVIKEVPEILLEVKYTKSNKVVNLGNELTPTQAKDIPEVKYTGDAKNYYTLILVDPDVPSRKNPIQREFQHWLVSNIPGNKISEGEVITQYVGPAPPKGSDLHRYVFLLFKQPSKLKFDEPRHSNTDKKRGNFSTESFTKKYNLGKPIAGNYFQAKFDESVPVTQEKLGQ